jgi:hypothetical protein
MNAPFAGSLGRAPAAWRDARCARGEADEGSENRMAKRKSTNRRVREVVQADASLEQAQKTSLLFASLLQAHGSGHGHDDEPSVREEHHNGHHIVIKTTYEVTVDGKPFHAALGVSNSGRVQYHGIPNVGFASAIDLMKCVIDQFPADFPRKPGTPASGGGHGGHGGHGHRVARSRSRTRKRAGTR